MTSTAKAPEYSPPRPPGGDPPAHERPAHGEPARQGPAVGVVPAAAPSSDGAPAIDVRGLTKRYGRHTVVHGLDLAVPAGVVAGFVGPNGAGKTTTLRMLLGLVRPSAGAGTVLGEPLDAPARYLPRVGALIEGPALYPTLSGRRNLASLAVLAGQDQAGTDEILDRVGLTGRGDDAVRTYSLGMKQRLAIGAALLSDPDLLILDEPTNGLDPAGIRQMRDLIRSLAQEPSHGSGGPGGRARSRTVLVSSHLLAEVEQICDWIIVLDRGRLAYQGPTHGFMAAATSQVELRPEHPAALGMLADLVAGLGLSVDRLDDRLLVDVGRPDQNDQAVSNLAVLSRAAHARDITLVEIAWRRASLEERYQGLVDGVRAGTGPNTVGGAR